ncbi:MAG: hypothetical protein Q7S24_01945 [bacterium]|nr:hypothetical protein [bacterium]
MTEKKPLRSTEDIKSHYRSRETASKSWLWLGVLSITAIIVFFWGWAIFSKISTTNWNKTPESDLADQTKKDWNQIFSGDGSSLVTLVSVKSQISNIVEEFKKQTIQNTTTLNFDTATTTTSTTVVASTTIVK